MRGTLHVSLRWPVHAGKNGADAQWRRPFERGRLILALFKFRSQRKPQVQTHLGTKATVCSPSTINRSVEAVIRSQTSTDAAPREHG